MLAITRMLPDQNIFPLCRSPLEALNDILSCTLGAVAHNDNLFYAIIVC